MTSYVLKIGSLLILAIIFSAVSVTAQSNRTYRAQISFDFIAGNKLYKSGKYIIRVENIYESPLLTVENAETRKWKKMPAATSGSRSEVNKTVLMFDRYGDRYILTQVISPDFGLTAPRTKLNKMLGEKFSKPDHSVAVVLQTNDRLTE
jgi:hypothetical protein